MFRTVFIILFLCLCLGVSAQSNYYSFSNYNENQGLVDNIIFCMFKDSKGILWVGTQNGLSRFDGSNFYNFKRKRNCNSLPHNSIESICEDKQGRIWGGTDNGIFCYNPLQNKFENYRAPKECVNNVIVNICCDKEGNVFATTGLDIIKYNVDKKVFEKVYSYERNKWIDKNKLLYDSTNHQIWLALSNGLNCYDIQSNKIRNIDNMPNNKLFNLPVASAIALAPNGHIWFCTNQTKELIEFEPKSKYIVQKISLGHVPNFDRPATILADSKKRLWLSTWSYDVMCIHTQESNRIDHLHSDNVTSTSIAGSFFWSAVEDQNGSIWFGTTNGISVCNADKHVYKACNLPERIPELASNGIYLIKEDPFDKTWWLSTFKNEIIHYFPTNGKYKFFYPNQFQKNKSGYLPGNIFEFHFELDKVLVSTENGMWQNSRASQSFKPYRIGIPEIDTMSIRQYIATDTAQYYSDNRKLVILNKQTKRCQTIFPDKHQVNRIDFQNLIWKPNHKLAWLIGKDRIGTLSSNGQIIIDNLIKDTVAESGGYLHAADMDAKGNVWVINKGVGLYKFDTKNRTVTYYTDFDGLVNNHLHAVLAAKQNQIWCTYFNKVSVLNTKTNLFTNFTIPYAEKSTEYFNTLNLRSDGIIMGNIYNDVFEFFPENLNQVPSKFKPQFGVVSIGNSDYFPNEGTKLFLHSNQNAINIKFGFLVDKNRFQHEFEYFLEGLDKSWHQISGRDEINYTNLAPGKYIFHILARDKNNTWRSLENSFQFTIQTPFYKTFWFLSMMALIIISSIYAFYRYRLLQKEKLMHLESRAQLLEKEKSLVMYESLKQQLNPHFLFNSLTSLSGLIQLDQNLASDFLDQMSGIYRYILKHDDSEAVYLKDEVNFVQLYIKLLQTRFSKGLIISIDISEEYLNNKIAPVTLQNLIENAIKHNIIDVEIPLRIDIFIEDEYIIVKNNLQRKNKIETSNKKGLNQFISLYKYLSNKPVLIEETKHLFQVKVPLI